ncbi:dipeptidase [Vagococcus elongatus]|uniref:Peptidase n=1 Tax=Vagococcus elongatus TaxID=180344 RepID=A0A430ANB4_9ENTE|nr:dipeptidase [Vagococcus elongatus]RSU09579.1 peptidase [Vagococcus elongatus]
MEFIDLHCDTLLRAFTGGQETIYDLPDCMLDVKRMKSANALAQFFAIFMLPLGHDTVFTSETFEDDFYIESLLKIFQNTMTQYGDIIAPAYDYKSYQANKAAGKMSGFLTFEDGRAINGDLDKLKKYYDFGIRLISLTWNYKNCFGYPNSENPVVMNQGLTDFGKEAIPNMNDLGIIIDVSHLSDGGFYDVAKLSKKPFIASHSNYRGLSPHPRNLTEDMIRVLANKGGVTGINFCPKFLSSDITSKESKVSDMILHIKKIIKFGGEECVAIGSDFDGVTGNLEISSVDKMPLLFESLAKTGISSATIDKIAYKNAERVIKDIL